MSPFRPCVVLALAMLLASPPSGRAADPTPDATWRDVIRATEAYKSSLERLLGFHERDVARARELVERGRDFLARGIISRRELEAREARLARARATAEETQRQIATADTLIAEAVAHEQRAARPRLPEPEELPLVRNAGSAPWSLAEATRIQAFFERRFGRPLPVSAWGQTSVHDRFGLDHHNALDVAVHPDSAEGRALTAFLRSVGIPFVAMRATVPGAATGAHIHVGPESHRLAVH